MSVKPTSPDTSQVNMMGALAADGKNSPAVVFSDSTLNLDVTSAVDVASGLGWANEFVPPGVIGITYTAELQTHEIIWYLKYYVLGSGWPSSRKAVVPWA